MKNNNTIIFSILFAIAAAIFLAAPPSHGFEHRESYTAHSQLLKTLSEKKYSSKEYEAIGDSVLTSGDYFGKEPLNRSPSSPSAPITIKHLATMSMRNQNEYEKFINTPHQERSSSTSLSAEELDALRIQRVKETQTANNWDCGTFRAWLNDDHILQSNASFCLNDIGCYDGRIQISEYYDLALIPGGGCGNALGRRVTRLDGFPIEGSIHQSADDPDIYEGYHIVTAYFGPDFTTFDDFFFISKGNLVFSRVQFVPGTGIIKKWATDTFENEIIRVSQQFAAEDDPLVLCSIINDTQNLFTFRYGFYPSNITGFEFITPQGFPDCVNYWTNIQLEGEDKCGTPLATHTLSCSQLHCLTFLGNSAEAVHAEHWGKQGLPAHSKCIDFCLPVLETCDENADPIPDNEVNFEQGVIDYSCRCPDGWKGNGVDSCEPVTCSFDFQCKGLVASHCDLSQEAQDIVDVYQNGHDDQQQQQGSRGEDEERFFWLRKDHPVGICRQNPSFSWNPITGRAFCPDDSKIYYNITTRAFECIADHKCWNKLQCVNQKFNTVSCNYPGNLASPLGLCECNFGYEGGYVIPCTCPDGKVEKRVAWGERICIEPNECTKNSHCSLGETCVKNSAQDFLGQCQ